MTSVSSIYPICYVTRPLSEYNLFPAIESLFKCHQYIQGLEAEIADLQEKIETRKLVERAKGLLMEQLKVGEAEAYRRMQKQSMDRCLSMRKVAEAHHPGLRFEQVSRPLRPGRSCQDVSVKYNSRRMVRDDYQDEGRCSRHRP